MMSNTFKNNHDGYMYAVTMPIVSDSFINLLREQDGFANFIQSGQQDEMFKDKLDSFYRRYKLFTTKEEALQHIDQNADQRSQLYLLTLQGSKETVEQEVKNGKLSQLILKLEVVNKNENRNRPK